MGKGNFTDDFNAMLFIRSLNVITHSQGFRSDGTHIPVQHDLDHSMSFVANCRDNAAAERSLIVSSANGHEVGLPDRRRGPQGCV